MTGEREREKGTDKERERGKERNAMSAAPFWRARSFLLITGLSKMVLIATLFPRVRGLNIPCTSSPHISVAGQEDGLGYGERERKKKKKDVQDAFFPRRAG